MRRIAIAAMLLMVSAMFSSVDAAETKVHGRLYTHWGLDVTSDADGANEFALGRSYVTVKSKLSDYTSLRITTDLRETEDNKGKTRYDIIVKYGYIDWKPIFGNEVLKLRFGLQPTPYIDFQNKLWGRRYLSKTVGDKNKYLTSSDLGLSAHIALGEKGNMGSLFLGVYNGTSYSALGEENKHKDVILFARLNPFRQNDDLGKTALTGQFYRGTQNKEIPDSVSASDYERQLISIGGLFSYRKLIDLGIDLNWYNFGQEINLEDKTSSGMSFHGTMYFNQLFPDQLFLRTLNMFGRVDLNDPNTDNSDDGNTYIIAGLECVPTKGFKASINLRSTSFQDDTEVTEKHLFINTLFKF